MTETNPTPPATETPAQTTPNPAPLALQQEPKSKGLSDGLKRGAIIGAVLGLPASYWAQNEMVRAKMNVVDYTIGIFSHSQAFMENGLYPQVVAGVVACALIGAAIGQKFFK